MVGSFSLAIRDFDLSLAFGILGRKGILLTRLKIEDLKSCSSLADSNPISGKDGALERAAKKEAEGKKWSEK